MTVPIQWKMVGTWDANNGTPTSARTRVGRRKETSLNSKGMLFKLVKAEWIFTLICE